MGGSATRARDVEAVVRARWRRVVVAYCAWTLACAAIVLARDGLSPDNVTHLGIGAYLAITFALRGLLAPLAGRAPGRFFVAACVVSAAVVETCYMISAPLHPSLRIDSALAARDAARNLAVDLALTAPAYVIIFSALWALLRRYAYRSAEFVLLTSAGQALGDAGAFLAAQPRMLLFLPWLMLNYQAMTLVPVVLVRDRLGDARPRAWLPMYAAPLLGIPVLYAIVGAIILYIGRAVGWIPA